MKKLFVFLGVALTAIGSALSAQEVDSSVPLQKSSWGDAKGIADYIPDISMDARFEYSRDITEKTGRFGGNGIFLDIEGKINSNFSYSVNHRIASFEGEDGIGFDNTNWMLLTYETEKFSISAGKDALFVGSFEYDAYDLDSYWQMNSLFWNTVNPWQWGISGAYYPTDGQSLSIQFCNSPFSSIDTGNLFAYALAWRGEWDFYESYWSTNLWQYAPNGYVSAINLGNRLYLGDFTIDLEYMSRGSSLRGLFSDDVTAIVSPSYQWTWGRAFAKCGWENIKEDTLGYEFTGSNVFYGAGLEILPIKDLDDIRLHAVWASNTNYTGGHFIEIGLTWKMNLTKAGKHIFNKLQK